MLHRLRRNRLGLVLGLLTAASSGAGSDPFLGEIRIFAGNFPPRGWAFCEGQLLPINQNQSLFSLLGTAHGGDGRTSFGLPDLRGRAPVHVGTGPNLDPITWGQKVGSTQVTMNINTLPNHLHDLASQTLALVGSEDGPDTDEPDGAFPATQEDDTYTTTGNPVDLAAGAIGAVTVSTLGATNQPIPNNPPYLAMHYIIALQGVFPSRN